MALSVTFLGTSGAVPTARRNPTALFVAREGEQFLFDAGEGTQRQMMRFRTGFGVSHLFVSHLHGDHVLGIPGLLQTMDFNEREAPLTIHGPRGTRGRLEALVDLLNTRPSFPVHIREVGDGEVAHRGEDYEVRTVATEHDTASVGYALVEDDRKGRFDRERAEALGVPVGPAFSRLHDGEPVELDDGTVVHPDEVVGEPRPGRSIVFTGDTRPTDAVVRAADEPDLLIHDATFTEELAGRARSTAHSTAAEAGDIARRAGAKRLALVHLSSRYAGDGTDHHREASEHFDGTVLVPEDGDVIDVPYPDA